MVALEGFLCKCTTVLDLTRETAVSSLLAFASPNFGYQVISGNACLSWAFPLDGDIVAILWLILHKLTRPLNPGILNYV